MMVHATREVAGRFPELRHLLTACASAMGTESVALCDKASALDDAIAHGDLETSTTLRDEITTLIVRAFLREKEHRASAVDCARTNARELHGRCAVVLPAIADALRDVRAYEERLVAHQRAAIEALEAIPGAVAARAQHTSGPAS